MGTALLLRKTSMVINLSLRAPTSRLARRQSMRLLTILLAGLFVANGQYLAATDRQETEADVVVYGGTPGGIAAAIAAARQGRSATLVAYNFHLGGMIASGLGKSDIENRAMIQGLFKELIDRVANHYAAAYRPADVNIKLCRDGYYYEPSVVEKVLEDMVREQPLISVMKGWRLESAETRDNRLRTIDVTHRRANAKRRLKGHIFIDATYEGDLYAAAGANYRLGRESREHFREPHAGVIYFDYQTKRILPGTTGAGDARLPAYTYRLCLTRDPKNAYRMKEAPPDYDRSRYTGYFEDLESGRLAAPKSFKPGRGYNPAHFDTLVRALSVTEIPNNKTDVNINPRPLAFPFPEENVGYIEGDDATREEIRRRHRNLTLGLLWFLQNDPEVPESHRALANELHLAKDEFTDNGHFPFQLYVREGRRLVGEYTLTEHDITGEANATDERLRPRRHVDSIAVGEFPIDSFPCRKRQPDDAIVLEGYLGMLDHITRPYEIPYRIMIPEKINGLIVPVAASTTHVAYSSIRMEPTWMALGQAAGTAAHLAVEATVPPRSVPIARLQRLLAQQGQLIRRPVDQTDPLMLDLANTGDDPERIDFDELTRLPVRHATISDVRDRGGKWVHQHAYLAHHQGKYWAMWSDGPGVPRASREKHRNIVPGHDQPDTRVSYATSPDGLQWSAVKPLSGPPRTDGFGWIARGFWQREGDLLALASHFNAPGYMGKGLSLEAFRWDNEAQAWTAHGTVQDDALNNFPPKKLPNGQWMMSRRDHRRHVSMMVGGTGAFDDWQIRPLSGYGNGQQPEEPYWHRLADGRTLVGLLRDNARSRRLLRTYSKDNGQTWSRIAQTNFPDATSKFFALRLSNGYFALVSNSNPKGRDPLTLAISPDGQVYTHLFYLVGQRHIDYPHMIEHDGSLLISFSGAKQTVETLKISLKEIEKLL